MIKSDILREFRPSVRYKDGMGITLEAVQNAIQDCAINMGIRVMFKKDQVKSGGLFNSSTEDCLIMYHPDHEKDYFNFCIRVAHQGTFAYISVNDFGQSKQMGKAARAEAYKEDREGKDLSYKIGSMIGQGLTTMGRNKQKFEEEQRYYECISDIFDEIIS